MGTKYILKLAPGFQKERREHGGKLMALFPHLIWEAGSTGGENNRRWRGLYRLGVHTESFEPQMMKEGTEWRESYFPTLLHIPEKPREAEGPRRNEFSQRHLPGRREVPSSRGLGQSVTRWRPTVSAHGRIAESLRAHRSNLRANLGLGWAS